MSAGKLPCRSTLIALRRPVYTASTLSPQAAVASWANLLTLNDNRILDYRFGQLLECIGFHWYAVSATDYPAGDYPHFKVMLESEINGDDRLLRGEIITITDIMATRLKTKSLRQHTVAPVRPPPPTH